jgi:hypothetical protein
MSSVSICVLGSRRVSERRPEPQTDNESRKRAVMLIHPTILELMAQSTNDERVGEALRLRAAHTERGARERRVRVWLARVLLRAALRLDAHAAHHRLGPVRLTGD